MSAAVTANALIRFARVERSISPRIGYTPEEQTNAAGDVLNRINKGAIDFHFDRRRGRGPQSGATQHRHGGRGRRLASFLVHHDKGLMKKLRDVEIIVRRSRRNFIEIRAAL